MSTAVRAGEDVIEIVADLIVVGAHWRTSRTPLLMGSTTFSKEELMDAARGGHQQLQPVQHYVWQPVGSS